MKRLIITAVVTLFGLLHVQGQNNLTLYNMKPIPQKFYVNPANQSDAKIFVGLPGISSNYFDFGLSAFKLGDVVDAIRPDENGDTTFMLGEFTDGFKKKNFISISNAMDLFSFGFKLKKNYFFFNTSLVNNVRFTAPGDFFQFIAQGNGACGTGRKQTSERDSTSNDPGKSNASGTCG